MRLSLYRTDNPVLMIFNFFVTKSAVSPMAALDESSRNATSQLKSCSSRCACFSYFLLHVLRFKSCARMPIAALLLRVPCMHSPCSMHSTQMKRTPRGCKGIYESDRRDRDPLVAAYALIADTTSESGAQVMCICTSRAHRGAITFA